MSLLTSFFFIEIREFIAYFNVTEGYLLKMNKQNKTDHYIYCLEDRFLLAITNHHAATRSKMG